MCLTSEAVDDLHAITTALKETQRVRDVTLTLFNNPEQVMDVPLTRAEAELIFANRIAAHEAKLKDLGWSRTIRVEPSQPKDGYLRDGAGNVIGVAGKCPTTEPAMVSTAEEYGRR